MSHHHFTATQIAAALDLIDYPAACTLCHTATDDLNAVLNPDNTIEYACDLCMSDDIDLRAEPAVIIGWSLAPETTTA
jgi:hypothetical protein